uniref:C-type lectin domain-containing protein n=1 Tax=Parastrongyloides trichosuri TaxID=131310 RepID=A0A0N4ZL13_PARTI
MYFFEEVLFLFDEHANVHLVREEQRRSNIENKSNECQNCHKLEIKYGLALKRIEELQKLIIDSGIHYKRKNLNPVESLMDIDDTSSSDESPMDTTGPIDSEEYNNLPMAKNSATFFNEKETIRAMAVCRMSRRTMLGLNKCFKKKTGDLFTSEKKFRKFGEFQFYVPKINNCWGPASDDCPIGIHSTVNGAYVKNIGCVSNKRHMKLCAANKIDSSKHISL